jgi:hypothetical protein
MEPHAGCNKSEGAKRPKHKGRCYEALPRVKLPGKEDRAKSDFIFVERNWIGRGTQQRSFERMNLF